MWCGLTLASPVRRRRGWRVVAVLLLACVAGGAVGCVRRRVPAAAAAQPGAQAASPITVTALPVFRLITTPVLVDSPSRLLVIQVRLSTGSEGAYHFAPDGLVLTLPNGGRARVFDRDRALILLQRTSLAEANLNYLQQPDHPEGGVNPYVRPQLAEMVGSQLLTYGVFGGGQVLQGYLVVDTGESLMSLDGAAIEVVAYRLSDSTPRRDTYQFATAPAATAPAGTETQ